NGKVCREYVSRDRGNTWSLFTSDLSEGSPVGVGGHNQSILFGVASGGLVESNDGRKTWPAVASEKLLTTPILLRGRESSLHSFQARGEPVPAYLRQGVSVVFYQIEVEENTHTVFVVTNR